MAAWAISSEAENPGEIFAFFDWLSTYEGQLIGQYGVEGLTYNMVDGYPVLTERMRWRKINANDTEWMINDIGAAFGGSGVYFYAMAVTNVRPQDRTLARRVLARAPAPPLPAR